MITAPDKQSLAPQPVRYTQADVPDLLVKAAEAGLMRMSRLFDDDTQQALLRFANALATQPAAPATVQDSWTLEAEPVAQIEDWPDDHTRIGIVPLVDIQSLPIGTKLYRAEPAATSVERAG